MQTDEIIQKLREISNIKVDGMNEENVKHHIVTKILEILGYSDVLDLEHKSGIDRPDIIIKAFELPIVIEVKGTMENLVQYIEPQIKRYSDSFRSCLSILTNGKQFYVFSPFWRRKTFEETLILSFTLKDLGNRDIAERVVALLNKAQGYKSISEAISKIEKEIENKGDKINELKNKIGELENEKKLLEGKYPNIEGMREFKELFTPDKKADLERHSSIKEQITKCQEEISTIKKQIPSVGLGGTTPASSSTLSPSKQIVIQKGQYPPSPIRTIQSSGEHFYRGIANEVINIKALQQGKQIILCKNNRTSNDHIFLLPKTEWGSDFTPSDEGRKWMGGSIDRDRCKHVAVIEYLDIPGKNRDFWQQLYDTGEFNLWVIDEGPWEYFNRSKKRQMLLWIFRVYEMPFEIQEHRDFIRISQGNCKMISDAILKKVQSEFENGKFTPVLSDNDFNRRKQNIIQIAQSYLRSG